MGRGSVSLVQRIPFKRHIYGLFLAVFVTSTLFTSLPTFAAAPTISNVSTGDNSACAVVDGVVKCWGSNVSGKLGIGVSGGSRTSPVAVATNKDPIAAVSHCLYWGGWCYQVVQDSPAIAPSALADKYVEKVSVGVNHACAMANARVYCWGRQ